MKMEKLNGYKDMPSVSTKKTNKELKPSKVVGVILAGGKSARMGQNKALLPFKNTRLIDHMEKLLKKTGCSQVVVSGNVEGFICIEDIIPNTGPLGGILSVLEEFKGSNTALLFIPVDMPELTSETLHKLITTMTTKNITATCYQKQTLPFAIYSSEIAIETATILLSSTHKSESSIKNYLNKLNCYEIIPPNNVTCFNNINNSKQWQQFTESNKVKSA